MLAADVSTNEAIHQLTLERSQAEKRFTEDGDVSLENHLAAICAAVLQHVRRIVPPRRLEALLLGGGYGRGEGGVLKTLDGDQPYNDLEFYIFIRGNRFLNRRRFTSELDRLAHEMTRLARVEVEFHIISSAQLRRSKPSMFYYDLIVGNHRLHGGENVLHNCEHHRDPRRLPPAEGTRLLMNRGTGLLLAREKLSNNPLTAEDSDFIARNVAKAQLALGDAVLTVFGRYHWSCRERNRRLNALEETAKNQPWFHAMCRHHDAGTEFKLHPHRSNASAGELKERFQSVADLMLQVWLWSESRRFQSDFLSARQYATSTLDKCPETNPWRNQLLNARVFGLRNLMSRSSRRHPRERILNALSILLWDREDSAKLLPHFLISSPDELSTNSVEIYRRLWEHVR